ncbi:MAG TPA: hypothetical protein VG868_02315 [Casimicrobiaceae bacterium]|nr:hypothetical protein [Casimicrobiaceae bacterium]
MHALRNIHSALVPNGLLVDTQPISPHPRVTAGGGELGALDMREWIETIQAVDERINETIVTGLYDLTDERELVVTSIFDDGPDCLEIASAWRGTRVPRLLADRRSPDRARLRVDRRAAAARMFPARCR